MNNNNYDEEVNYNFRYNENAISMKKYINKDDNNENNLKNYKNVGYSKKNNNNEEEHDNYFKMLA